MAESQQYLLGNERFVTVSIDEFNSEIYKINSDGSRTIYADYDNGRIIPSTFSSPEFRENVAKGQYTNTINESVDNARGLPPTQVTDPNQPGAPGGSTPANPNTPEEAETPATGAIGLVYPSDLAALGQDRIKFQAYDYKSGDAATRLPGGSGRPTLSSPIGNKVGPAVYLPIQSPISDQNLVGWEQDTLNPIEMYAANASIRLMQPESNVTQVASEEFTKALQRLRSSSKQVQTYLAGQAIGVNNLLSRLNGQVLNPNLELLFQGPQLRPFSFTFKLSPRDDTETKTVKSIINYFKKNMAPILEDSKLFLETPNVFEIKYEYNGESEKDHPGLNLIKQCALTNCSVDYTPLGTYMTYQDGTMVSYTLTLQFQELEPVYSKDYTDHPIGY